MKPRSRHKIVGRVENDGHIQESHLSVQGYQVLAPQIFDPTYPFKILGILL